MSFEQQQQQQQHEQPRGEDFIALIYAEFRPELKQRSRKMRKNSIVDFDVQSFDDYYNDAFVRLILKIEIGDKFESKEKVFGFIARTVYFRYFPKKGLKYKAKIVSCEEDLESEELEIDNEKLNRIVNAFSPKCKEIYRLLFDGHSQKEIAAILGCSYNTFRNRKSECLRAVKKELTTA